ANKRIAVCSLPVKERENEFGKPTQARGRGIICAWYIERRTLLHPTTPQENERRSAIENSSRPESTLGQGERAAKGCLNRSQAPPHFTSRFSADQSSN